MQPPSFDRATGRRRRRRHAAVLLLALAALAFSTTACADTRIYTETFKLGPFNLAPKGQNGAMNSGLQRNVPRPAGDVAIRNVSFDLINEATGQSTGHAAHLHHVVFGSNKRLDAACGTRGPAGFLGGERFMASGDEKTPVDFTGDYRYWVNAGDSWSALWDVMNESAQPLSVSIAYTITYTKGAPKNMKDVTPFWFDATTCGASSYNVPGDGGPGSIHSRTATFTMPSNGTALGSGGHLHNGGIDVSIKRASNGEVLCTSVPEYHGNPPHIASMSRCTEINKPVAAGENLTITSRYDNSAPISGAMGIMVMYMDFPA
jgi:hypothetical protein